MSSPSSSGRRLSFTPLGDAAVRVKLGDAVDPGLSREVRAYDLGLRRASIPGVVEWVPAYTSLTVFYQPHRIRYADLCRALEGVAGEAEVPSAEVFTLPVLYGGEAGPDLGFVARHHGLTEEEVIARHSREPYLIYMIGFAPGFPYLGDVPPELATPRLDSPRRAVPAGSVGIGGSQTGVYPLETPGGWRIIGRTPVRLFDPRRPRPILLEAGNCLRFRPVTAREYSEIEARVNEGTFEVERG